jgi:lambda family phage portal protein
MGKRAKKRARQPTNIKKNAVDIARKVVNTGYSETGASHSKGSMQAWNPIRSSPASDIDANLDTLRGRSASLYMGTPIAVGAIRTSCSNVIGAGLHVSPRPKYGILGINAEQAAVWAKKVEEEFDMWASSKDCDLYRKNNFYDMQDIAYLDYLIDGDSFAAFQYRKATPTIPYALRLQLIEGTRVCNPDAANIYGIGPLSVEAHNSQNGNRIIDGVEIDGDGAVVAYWVCNRYPYDPTDLSRIHTWQRVEAFGAESGMPNILQVSHDERPEQLRGVPYLAPVLEMIKQIGRFGDAELTSAIVKSFFSLFIKETSSHDMDANPPLTEALDPHEKKKAGIKANDFLLGPGTMNVLPTNYDVVTVDPQRSLSTFEPFTTMLIKQVGAAIGIPYEVLMKSFNSSYTASRAALLQAWSQFKMRRTWFSRDLCQPVYERWLAEAIMTGRIDAPGYFEDPLIRKAWANTEWYGPVMGVLDPVKEVQAANNRIALGVSTHEKESVEMTGTSWDDNIERLAIENNKLNKNNIPLYPLLTKNADTTNTEKDVDPQEGAKK